MIYPGFVLMPLYFYPILHAWDPLFNAATKYPSLTFLAIINPDSGPGKTPCPGSDYVTAIQTLSTHKNIVTLGYVPTNFTTRPQLDVQADINKYQAWSKPTSTGGCGIQVNGTFFDEAPNAASGVTYMKNVATYAKQTLTHGNTIVFNPGTATDPGYWQWADYIVTLENTEAFYDNANIASIDGNGKYSEQTVIILHDYASSAQTEENDVDTIIDNSRDNIAGLYITELTEPNNTVNPYRQFPARWDQFCGWVDAAN